MISLLIFVFDSVLLIIRKLNLWVTILVNSQYQAIVHVVCVCILPKQEYDAHLTPGFRVAFVASVVKGQP